MELCGDDPPLPPPPPELAAARSIEDFLEDPRDRYIARRTFCYWQLGTRYKGCIVWGRPGEADAREMIQAFDAGVRLDEVHSSMADMRDLASVDIMGFGVIMRYMVKRQPIFEQTIRRQAILHGSGVVGSAVAGFYRVVRPSYPTAEFSELREAVEWFAPEDPESVIALINDLRSRFIHRPEIVSALRAALERNQLSLSAADAAREMGMSLRSLQRALSDADTSFRKETDRFRLESAERLLSGSSMSVKAIAGTLGTPPERLATLFRRAHGVTAQVWRSRFRRETNVDDPSGGDAPDSDRE